MPSANRWTIRISMFLSLFEIHIGLPCGPLVKNPSNAGDVRLIQGQETKIPSLGAVNTKHVHSGACAFKEKEQHRLTRRQG